ncbi:pyrroline-5-carboxylate reductase [Bacillus sp. DTU_2020_1000418_1_SI_GHA_SEK_038]|uniref:pyrroline-5-carboxylate reductase n=1 Tax=Bacillus sp. DTU_2020_1000418_1_SI_GHA_SEK_038 TaxID=3077585 RepID=UPI0028E1D84B|nr:pyrroline-5-carboxylate reductase [Bacillus sp. DTU_2020_1000418_1_SI_GHA_SEK_038]WNS75419.1 pyrroline-5-carboxylate reductase [Bacillus sp. DTU_2020_1000418_1_SI_GHA_SEK_038]
MNTKEFSMMKVGFVGTGNMASAIIKGMIHTEHTKAKDIFLFDVDMEKMHLFASETETNTCASCEELVEYADILVLAVKPNQFEAVLTSLKECIKAKNPLLVSIAAGTSIEKIQQLTEAESDLAIIRVMPNVNAMIGEGAAAVCGNKAASQEQVNFVLDMFNAIGMAIELPEHHFSTFTAIAGSSPAYAYLFIDSLARGAVKNGLPKDLANKIAAQAVLGSAKMILESDEDPWVHINRVCSPGGTTVAGLVALEDHAFISTVIKGVDATIKRDEELMKN